MPRMSDYDYPNMRRIGFKCGDEGTAQFVPVCMKCGRFVKPYKRVRIGSLGPVGNNAWCKKHGRTEMVFEGFI